MLITLVALLAGLPAAGPLAGQSPGAAPPNLNDHGTFEIVSAGQNLGTESFEIRARSDEIEAKADVHLRVQEKGTSVEVRTSCTLVLDPQFNPLSYSWSQKGSQPSQLSIDFSTDPVHARRKGPGGQDEQRDFKLDRDVLILDDNVIHHYQLAVARYDQAKGGTQAFRAFIPQEALPGVVTVNSAGSEAVTVGGEKQTLRRFFLTTELAQISLWVDDRGHLQLVSAPDAQYQATRKK